MGMSVNLVRAALRDQHAHASLKMRAAFALFAFACGASLIGVILISSSRPLLARDFTFGIALAFVATAAAALFPRSSASGMTVVAAAPTMSGPRSPAPGHRGDSLFVL